MTPLPFLLDCSIQRYAWGSVTALAALQGREPDGQPEAEMWIGAHPHAPSRDRLSGVALDSLIGDDPAQTLGEASRAAFGDSLPFLLKVLAAGAPLSLQAHPSRAQAIAGFEAEERAGVSINDPTRVFKDRNHKPELICALTDFEAVCGFRPVERTAALFEALATPTTVGMAARLRTEHPASALRFIVGDLLSSDATRAQRVVSEVISACSQHNGGWSGEADLAVRLNAAYPGDVGAIISLLLNRVVLRPGEALMLGAGNLHAYICGVGVELMANSDNVLRGGLTPKHVDVKGLLEVVDWKPLADPVVTATGEPGLLSFPSPSDEFRLDVIDPASCGGDPLVVGGPELLWCHTGQVEIKTANAAITVNGGDAVFVPAAAGSYQVSGTGQVFRATVGRT